MELSATLSLWLTKVKNPRTLCDLFTYIYACRTCISTFLIILHIIEHVGVTVRHAANTINTFSANLFYSKTYHHTYKSTRKTENSVKVLRFQSENGIKYTYTEEKV